MAPKGGNAKKESGRANKKAANDEKKKLAEAQEFERKEENDRKEDDDWKGDGKGGKSKQEDKVEKRKADLARKAENARFLEEEEAKASAKPKPTPKKKGAKDIKPAGPGAIAAGGSLSPEQVDGHAEVESYAATGIDNALDLLEVVTAKMDKASVGQQAAAIERHPERRFKAAFEAYLERELPNIKKEQPGLRLQQYRDLLYKQFQNSPENPFNQATIAYDANKEEKVQALLSKKEVIAEQFKS